MPLARAFADDGHAVAFATSASFSERVEAAGFELLPAGIDGDELEARFAPYRRTLRALPVQDRRPRSFTRRFATLEAPAKLAALHAAATAWRPELVIHESADLAAPIVATALGLPTVNHGFGQLIPAAGLTLAAEETAGLWALLGLDPEPLCGVYRGTYVDPCPPSFQNGSVPDGTPVERIRPLFPPAPGETAPAWLDELPRRRTVYVTLGTIHNELAVFRVLLDALDGLDANVVVTVGRGNDADGLGPVPANAVVERYVAQSFVLPRASVVVAHGGSGSLLAALAEGLPTLLVPQGADQFGNAARCVELGAGLALLPDEMTPGAVRRAVESLLAEESYRVRAGQLAEEIATLPHPRGVARRLAARQGAASSA